jgi:hydroxymethylglutaryl-CoA reductase
VPPDNNSSARATNNIKGKQNRLPDGQEISGQFKSTSGTEGFVILRFVTDTAIKSGQNVLNALVCAAIMNGIDWIHKIYIVSILGNGWYQSPKIK